VLALVLESRNERGGGFTGGEKRGRKERKVVVEGVGWLGVRDL
jgi:hypothetical protein